MGIFGSLGQTGSVLACHIWRCRGQHTREWAWLCVATLWVVKCEFYISFTCHEIVLLCFFQTTFRFWMSRHRHQARFGPWAVVCRTLGCLKATIFTVEVKLVLAGRVILCLIQVEEWGWSQPWRRCCRKERGQVGRLGSHDGSIIRGCLDEALIWG